MPESEEHSELVVILRSYIAEKFCEGQIERVYTDSVSRETRIRPPSIEGFVPDAFVMLNDQGRVAIGEAKTMGDLENSHTDAQVMAFLKRCRMAKGSAFILAVPWPIERLALTLLTNFQIRGGFPNIETVVLSEVNRMGVATSLGRLTPCRS